MGYPLSRFQMLAGLCSHEEYFHEAFSPFKLVCIVLHDPDDAAFKSKMQSRFADLYRRTGRDMLFITFVNPPKAWARANLELSLQEMERANLGAEPRFDDRLLLRHFMRSVSNYQSLPCILITHDLLSREYCLLDSSAGRIEQQLIRIGEFCSATGGRFPVHDDRFRSWVASLGNAVFSQLPARSIAEELAGTLALNDQHSRDGMARDWAKQYLSRLREAKDAAGDDAGPEALAYFNYREGMGSAVAGSLNNPNYRLDEAFIHGHDSPPEYLQYEIETGSIRGFRSCHPLSKDDIRQYNGLLPFYVAQKRSFGPSIFPEEEKEERRSFKPLGVFLTDFFEREINLSLVQQMRQCYGIEMPDYYCRYREGMWAVVGSGQERISLNSVRYPDEWVPVMFGQAYYAYRKMCSPLNDPHLDNPLDNKFLDLWYAMMKFRNRIGHTYYSEEDVFDYRTFQGFHKAASAVFRDYLWRMQEVKQSLLYPDRDVFPAAPEK